MDFDLGAAGSGGTLLHTAPERLTDRRRSAAADVYSLGLVIFEMLHGHAPWPELETSQVPGSCVGGLARCAWSGRRLA